MLQHNTTLPARTRMILWTGPKHAGKTTAAGKLIESVRAAGFAAAGILSLSLYEQTRLIGFDVLDIATNRRTPLARRTAALEETRCGTFTFLPKGLHLGNEVLSPSSVRHADLVIVDEFGPLELRGQGWRPAVDAMANISDALLLLVVRKELLPDVATLYTAAHPIAVDALSPESPEQVLKLLQLRKSSHAHGQMENLAGE